MFDKSLLLSCAAPVLMFALSPVSAHAQNAPIAASDTDEIIVTGLRSVSAKDVTASVSIIDSLDLEVRSSPYVVDQLRAAPGVAVSRAGALGGLTQIRLRGSEGNHTLVLLNGIEMSNPVSGETDFGVLSGLNIARIELARGEQSGLYGSDAIGGVVAMTTGDREGASASAEAGSFNTLRGQASANTVFDTSKVGVSVSGFQTDGVDTSGLGGEKDGSSAVSILANGEIELSRNLTMGGLASVRKSEVDFDSDTDFDGALNNAPLTAKTDQLIVGGHASLDAGALSHIVRASYTDVSTSISNGGVFADETIGQRSKFTYSPSYRFDADQAQITVTGLIDYESEDYERIDTNTLFGDPNQAVSFDTLGLAGEARVTAGAAAFNGSVRRDNNEGQFDSSTTWRMGAVYNFDFGGRLRASTGTGVKNPTFTELFGYFPGSFIGNPELTPETSKSWEVGYDHDFGSLQTSVTYFDAQLEDEITTQFNADFTSSPANLTDNSERSGVELTVDWVASEQISVNASATQLTSEDTSGADEIRRPKITASAAVQWRSAVKSGLRAGLSVDYVGEQDDFNFGAFPAERVTLGAYTLVSASAAYPIHERLSLTLRAENVLDETVQDTYSYTGTGAGVFAGFTLR